MENEMIPMWTLGDRLRKARMSAGIEPEDMAALFFRHRNTITNWELDHNRPSAKVIAKWAEVTRVPLWWIQDGQVPDSEPASNDRRTSRRITHRIDPGRVRVTGAERWLAAVS